MFPSSFQSAGGPVSAQIFLRKTLGWRNTNFTGSRFDMDTHTEFPG